MSIDAKLLHETLNNSQLSPDQQKYMLMEYILKPISIADLSESPTKVEMQIKASAQQNPIDSLETALRKLVLQGDAVTPSLQRKIAAKYHIPERSHLALVLFYYGTHYASIQITISHITCQKFRTECDMVCVIPLEKQKSYLYILLGVPEPEGFVKWLGSSVKIHS